MATWGRSDSGLAAMPGLEHLVFVATRMQIRMQSYPKWWVHSPGSWHNCLL